ncbi:MAG: class I fructose-bisphosphate aldolase [Nocardioides sp.]
MVAGERSQQTAPNDTRPRNAQVDLDSVPADLPGIAFLSGGQPIDQACANLSAITTLERTRYAPWRLTFALPARS